jgi:hypothetical protein
VIETSRSRSGDIHRRNLEEDLTVHASGALGGGAYLRRGRRLVSSQRAGHGELVVFDIDLELGPRSQPQSAGMGGQEPIRIRPGVAELMEELAEVIARLGLGRVRPQDKMSRCRDGGASR